MVNDRSAKRTAKCVKDDQDVVMRKNFLHLVWCREYVPECLKVGLENLCWQ